MHNAMVIMEYARGGKDAGISRAKGAMIIVEWEGKIKYVGI